MMNLYLTMSKLSTKIRSCFNRGGPRVRGSTALHSEDSDEFLGAHGHTLFIPCHLFQETVRESFVSKSYTYVSMPSSARSMMGSILLHLPPARPQPIRGMWTLAPPSCNANALTRPKHVSMAS